MSLHHCKIGDGNVKRTIKCFGCAYSSNCAYQVKYGMYSFCMYSFIFNLSFCSLLPHISLFTTYVSTSTVLPAKSDSDVVFCLQLLSLFCCFTSQVNSYGHGGTVSSPNHTFSWASLNKQLASTSCIYFRL